MRNIYGFNSSQDVINLQTKYSFFPRVANIVFTLRLDDGFDRAVMRMALELLVERNDCLRIRFIRQNGRTCQVFDDSRSFGHIPEYHFNWKREEEAFVRRFRRGKVKPEKGKVIKAAFAVNSEGVDVIYFKISHFVADTYAISVLIDDLLAVYRALIAGSPLPQNPGSFEAVLKKDLEYKDDIAATEKDREFYRDYYSVQHPEHPVYCGLHGSGSDRWKRIRKKGRFALPYLFVKCDTEGYRLPIPSALTLQAEQWCKDNGVSLSAFFFYTCSIAASLANARERTQSPLMLLDCRGTNAERRCGGTKVQSLSIYTTVDYDLSFKDNMVREYQLQNQLFRHTRLTYLDVEAIQHGQWGHSMLSQITNFCWSFIPFHATDGVSMQVLSNGKGALAAYIAAMYDVDSRHIDVLYDVQTQMITASQLMDFHRLYLLVVGGVLAHPEEKLSRIF